MCAGLQRRLEAIFFHGSVQAHTEGTKVLLTGERKKVLLTRMGFDRVSPGQNCRLKRSWPVEFRCPATDGLPLLILFYLNRSREQDGH